MTTRPGTVRARSRPLWTAGWVLLLVLILVGFGFVASRSAASPDTGPRGPGVAAAERSVDALLSPGQQADALAQLPADFTQVTGVTPGRMPAMDGTVRAVHVDGGCSAPWGDDNTKWDFGVPCRSHDLGYDLLRYAVQKGEPLGPDAREALDARLTTDMRRACDLNPMDSPGTCRIVATAYSVGLMVNSWHQRWGPPVGEPIEPGLAGLAVIGLLLAFRMRGWLRVRRSGGHDDDPPGRPLTGAPGGRWALAAVTALSVLMAGETAAAVAGWVGAPHGWLWPLTWLTQLSVLFLFAGGRSNLAGWAAVRADGGGYRTFLTNRASWLLRPALIFAVVAFAVPMALEVLRTPPGVADHVLRVALHPLWLLGLYLLTVVGLPWQLAAQRRAPILTSVALLAALAGAELLAWSMDSGLPRHLATIALALFVQQLAVAHAEHGTPRPWVLGAVGVAALGAVFLFAGTGLSPWTLLGSPDLPQPLAGPPAPVLLLGIAQLALAGLARGPLARQARHPGLLRACRFALRAPMSLYLCFLTLVLFAVAVVYLPGRLGDDLDWLGEPRWLLAVALLAVPAALVFWWFERDAAPPGTLAPTAAHSRSPEPVLGRVAMVLGIGYALLGVFGFALSGFSDGTYATPLPGVSVDPIQSLVHLLLGVCLLHVVRLGTAGGPATWVLTAIACVPSMMAATAGGRADRLSLTMHGGTALIAVFALLATVLAGRLQSRTAVINRT